MLPANDRNRSGAEGDGAELGAIVLGCVDALATADADRLEQMAVRCSELSVEFQRGAFACPPDASLMAGLARLNRVLQVTRANVEILDRLRHAETKPLEYVLAVQSSGDIEA